MQSSGLLSVTKDPLRRNCAGASKLSGRNTYTFQPDTQCSSTDCLLMLRCQLYMFRTVTVHPQELLFRCCMCRLWYVVRNALDVAANKFRRCLESKIVRPTRGHCIELSRNRAIKAVVQFLVRTVC